MPLVVQHAQVAYEDRWDWERENIPQHSDVRREREEEEYYARLFELNDQEIALLSRFREMDRDEREVLGAMLEPQTFLQNQSFTGAKLQRLETLSGPFASR